MRAGQRSVRQETITQVRVQAARRGRRVVRLTGGDSYVLGRGGEEAVALRLGAGRDPGSSHDGQGAIGKWIQTGIRRAKLLGLDLQPGADGAGGDVGNRPLQGLSDEELHAMINTLSRAPRPRWL